MDGTANPLESMPDADTETVGYETLPELHNLNEPAAGDPVESAAVPESQKPWREPTLDDAAIPRRPGRMPVIVLGVGLVLAVAAIAWLVNYTSELQTKIDQLTIAARAQNTPPELAIISASYGSGGSFADVTLHAKDVLAHPDTDFYAHPNWLGADPTPGWNKQLIVIYEVAGQRHLFTTGEGGKVNATLLRDDAMK